MQYSPAPRLCLLAMVALWCTTVAVAQTCLVPYYIDNAPGEPNFERGASEYNGYSDTLMIDTCRVHYNLKDLYAKERFHVSFAVGIVPSWVTQATTAVDFTWQDLSVSHPEVRSMMQSLAQRFGSYVIRRHVNPPENSPWGCFWCVPGNFPPIYQLRQS